MFAFQSPVRQREVDNQDAGGSRRQFLSQAGALAGALAITGMTARGVNGQSDEPENCAPPVPAGTAIPFQPDAAAPLRQRKSVWDLTPAEVTRLRNAYAALRNLTTTSPNDPRGWQQQANVHCWYCGGGLDSQATEEIHFSWWFFPWHRCYLYFHERILGKLINDPTLALPYWDWDNPSHRTLPPAYATPANTMNPLFDSQRGVGATNVLPASIFAAMGQIMNTSSTALFMGSNDPTAQNGGRIENGPHGAVHVWTGDPTMQNATQDMGLLSTAAQDPVFFTHHSNIDRLWDVWVRATTAHHNPSSSAWLTHRWTFYDENGQFRSISVADVISPEESLRYTYQESPPVPQAVHTFAILPQAAKLPLGPAPASHTADLPDQLQGLAAMASALPADAPRKAFVLHIDGVEAPVGATATVRVFVNKPDANPKTPLDAPNYLGEFTLLPATSKPRTRNQEKPHPRHLVFDVSPHVAALLKDKRQITVTLVPTTANDEQPEDRKITYQKIYLTVEK